MPTKSKTSASIEDIKRLYIRAGAHSRTRRRKGKETRHIEAFLLQTALLEGVLVSYGLKFLEDKADLVALKGKRGKWYGYDNAINDLYLLGAVNTDEFKKLEQFKAKRNEYIHNLLSENTDLVESKVLRIYKEYDGLVWDMIQRLEKKVGKITEPSN
mgnify:FL=1